MLSSGRFSAVKRTCFLACLPMMLSAVPATGQQPAPKPGDAAASARPGAARQTLAGEIRKTLDPLLAANDFDALARSLSVVPLDERLLWLRGKLFEQGGSVFLAYAYMGLLWQVGVQKNDSDPKTDVRATAGLLWLYIYQVIKIDGLRCEDVSAPEGRKTQFLTGFRPIYQFVRDMPPDLQAKVFGTSLKMESAIAPKRSNDFFLCSGGIAQFGAALNQSGGNQTIGDLSKNSTPSPGVPGGVVTLPKATGYVPKFLPAGTFEQKQAAMRTKLQSELELLFK
jgi:hypothetical protein